MLPPAARLDVATMIGHLWYRISRIASADAFPRRLLSAMLYRLSELEALYSRPEANFLRRLFLSCCGVEFQRDCLIGQGFRLYKTSAHRLVIGPNASLGENAGLYIHADLTIGADFVAAPGLTINNGTHDIATLAPRGEPLVIGNRVWCGVNVTLVAGASIGDDCVIGANSLVMSSIPTGSLAVGTPARVIRSNIRPAGAAGIWRARPPARQ